MALTAELREYYLHTGTLTPPKSASSLLPTLPLDVVNPTLLTPFHGAWDLHYSANPLESYTPFSSEELMAAATLAGQSSQLVPGSGIMPSNILCTAAVTRLSAAVSGYQRTVGIGPKSDSYESSLPIRFHLWLGDGLELSSGDSDLARLSFDFIDTSNVVDHVGLLAMVGGAVPKRLAQHHLARLRTDTMIWPSFSDSVSEYLEK